MSNDIVLKVESPITKSSISATGWELSESMTQEDWSKAGHFLVQVDQARQWWLGDWWNACKWGDGREACESIGVNYQTAQDCGWVAKAFQFSRRKENLRFSHHKEVCAIEEESLQDKLLEWAVENKATVRELREKVQACLAMKDWHETEKQRRFDVESGITVISNMSEDVNLINWSKGEGIFVAIDRSSPWGNPFEMPGDGTREEVCESYEIYFNLKKSLHKKLNTLKGKVLGCHCYPEQCHGDFIVKKLASKSENKLW